jgi:LDH2 family malate/lactate/ureidoglycolate dehydrogenase
MGHVFAAVEIEAFQPRDRFLAAMDAMIAPPSESNRKLCYPGEIESATAIERTKNGIPVSDYLFAELQKLADQFRLQPPTM